MEHPGVAQAIRDDLANTELLATFLRFVTAAAGSRSTSGPLAREATAPISEEVDYRHEAAMITAFSDLYRDHPFIRIPHVIPEASSDRVLTMTYLDGMDWAAAQQADQDLKNTWAEVIARFLNGNYRHANLVACRPPSGQLPLQHRRQRRLPRFRLHPNLPREAAPALGGGHPRFHRGSRRRLPRPHDSAGIHRRGLTTERRGSAALDTDTAPENDRSRDR